MNKTKKKKINHFFLVLFFPKKKEMLFELYKAYKFSLIIIIFMRF